MLIMSFGLPRLSLRIFPDATGSMWKANIKDIGGEVLCVSQFTLLANTQKGNKPDFHRAMLGHPFIHPVFFNPSSSHSSQATEPSRRLYATFLERMGQVYEPDKIKDGRFGAMMNVSLTNEGPVTFTLDSRKFEYVDQQASISAAGSTPKAERAAKWAKGGQQPDTYADATASTGRSEDVTAVGHVHN
ncbi:D-tyrosyl-tRNA(Tyr) deacylase [Steccherinum ochraceum]|uniref:D-aminoacyl-tRNA deacylase n=1 Tax=Steccherinum ochraceum TaxID=92696 RepID=A0A4R0RHZ7_9APHY|nr:D-tyrosyl-tRNA(Tyr) deacylase [Steccherinum ochraceum]